MLKKTITYTDFNGEKQTRDFYFNLTRAELISLELSEQGGFQAAMEKIIASNNGAKIIETFQQIIRQAYGEKSEDGQRFIKNKKMAEEFEQTAAYDELFIELTTDADKSAAFINGIVPADMVELAQQQENAQSAREKSEAQLQGHKAPQQKVDTGTEQVPNLPAAPESESTNPQ